MPFNLIQKMDCKVGIAQELTKAKAELIDVQSGSAPTESSQGDTFVGESNLYPSTTTYSDDTGSPDHASSLSTNKLLLTLLKLESGLTLDLLPQKSRQRTLGIRPFIAGSFGYGTRSVENDSARLSALLSTGETGLDIGMLPTNKKADKGLLPYTTIGMVHEFRTTLTLGAQKDAPNSSDAKYKTGSTLQSIGARYLVGVQNQKGRRFELGVKANDLIYTSHRHPDDLAAPKLQIFANAVYF